MAAETSTEGTQSARDRLRALIDAYAKFLSRMNEIRRRGRDAFVSVIQKTEERALVKARRKLE